MAASACSLCCHHLQLMWACRLQLPPRLASDSVCSAAEPLGHIPSSSLSGALFSTHLL